MHMMSKWAGRREDEAEGRVTRVNVEIATNET
jgi:hypothetical protein